jgi:hypothetical protein
MNNKKKKRRSSILAVVGPQSISLLAITGKSFACLIEGEERLRYRKEK